MTEIKITQYGFKFGPATVTRLSSDPKHGVWIGVDTDKGSLQIRVTKSGQFRIGSVEAPHPHLVTP